MTTLPRRKPAPKQPEPWPSQRELEPRVTTEGKVSSLPSPIQAMWAEAVGRVHIGDPDSAEGLIVALAILTCGSIEEVRTELNRRARVPVSRSR